MAHVHPLWLSGGLWLYVVIGKLSTSSPCCWSVILLSKSRKIWSYLAIITSSRAPLYRFIKLIMVNTQGLNINCSLTSCQLSRLKYVVNQKQELLPKKQLLQENLIVLLCNILHEQMFYVWNADILMSNTNALQRQLKITALDTVWSENQKSPAGRENRKQLNWINDSIRVLRKHGLVKMIGLYVSLHLFRRRMKRGNTQKTHIWPKHFCAKPNIAMFVSFISDVTYINARRI